MTIACRNKFSIRSCLHAPEVEGAKEALQRHPDANLKDDRNETWHELAENRTSWRQGVKKRVRFFEAERLKAREDKRQKRKAKEAQDIKVQQIPVSADFVVCMSNVL